VPETDPGTVPDSVPESAATGDDLHGFRASWFRTTSTSRPIM
jgi:hypothetical protein